MHRVRRGWYIDSAAWSQLRPEARHLAHTIAVARDSRGGGVMSHTSAAVLWDLPLYRARFAGSHHHRRPDPDQERHRCFSTH